MAVSEGLHKHSTPKWIGINIPKLSIVKCITMSEKNETKGSYGLSCMKSDAILLPDRKVSTE